MIEIRRSRRCLALLRVDKHEFCLVVIKVMQVGSCPRFQIAYIYKSDIIYILTDCQFGFRTGKSSSMAIVNLLVEITNSLDKMIAAISVFIDLMKAFDTIDHTILRQKLNHYGIRRFINKLVCSYLTHRKQYVQIKGTKSSLE